MGFWSNLFKKEKSKKKAVKKIAKIVHQKNEYISKTNISQKELGELMEQESTINKRISENFTKTDEIKLEKEFEEKKAKEIHIKREGTLLKKNEMRMPKVSSDQISEVKEELKKHKKEKETKHNELERAETTEEKKQVLEKHIEKEENKLIEQEDKESAGGMIEAKEEPEVEEAPEVEETPEKKPEAEKTPKVEEKKPEKEAPATEERKEDEKTSGFYKTQIPGFDELLDPGIPKGSAILIEGGPGSGKTLWCLTLLANMCKKGKKVMYMSFEEPEGRLRDHIASFGIDPKEYEKKGLLYVKRFNALDIARSVEALLSEAKKELLIDVQPVLIPNDFQPDIVLLDSLSSISSAFSGEKSRFRIYMEQLFRYLESHKISSILIREVGAPTHIGENFGEHNEAVSFLSDGIIAIYNVIFDTGMRKRAIEVLKMRGVKVDRKIVEYDITGKGVRIYPKKILKGKYKLT
jgi:circadian clock protein KaiC